MAELKVWGRFPKDMVSKVIPEKADGRTEGSRKVKLLEVCTGCG